MTDLEKQAEELAKKEVDKIYNAYPGTNSNGRTLQAYICLVSL
jgi:hypothetical protein